jgi:hypothetical protein
MGRKKRRGKARMHTNPQHSKVKARSAKTERFAQHLERDTQVDHFRNILREIRNPGIPAVATRHDTKYVLKTCWAFPNPKGFAQHSGKVTYPLYHGTKEVAIASIILRGFQMPRRGGMFGKAIYLAPNIAKALGYTNSENPLIFVCEARLGRIRQMTVAQTSLNPTDALCEGFDTVHGMAGYTASWGGRLAFSEYATYDPNRIRLLYLAEYKKAS